MKTKLLFIITVSIVLSIFSVNYAYAVPPLDSEFIYEISDSIVTGKVIFVNSTFSPNAILYHIEVEKSLKNPQNTNVIFAAGPNTEHPRIGNQIFDVGDRVLFFLQNTSTYDQNSEIFGVHYESAPVKPGWDDCDIFNTSIPKEHWVLGGRGPMLKVQQENSTNDNDFVIGKEVLITYDIFNHTPEKQTVPFGMTIMNKDDPDSLYIFTETTSLQLEPCVPYQTLTWSFTPSEYGYYAAKFDNLMGSRTTVGFTIEESKPDDNDSSSENEEQIPLKLDDFASKLWYEHELIIDGTILDITGFAREERTYDIKINSYFKPSDGKNFGVVTVNGFTPFTSSEGDRGIFFIKKEDAQWKHGRYGTKITGECMPELMYHYPPLIDPPLVRGSPPIDFGLLVDCYPQYYKKYLPQYMKERGATEFPSPRTQSIDGMPPDEVVCNEDLHLLLKPTEFQVSVCVTESTYRELANRGWSVVLEWGG